LRVIAQVYVDSPGLSADYLSSYAAREFDGSAFKGTPASPDLDWLRASVDYLVRRDS